MRVGLHDSDATGFPNLALMKHKVIFKTVETFAEYRGGNYA